MPLKFDDIKKKIALETNKTIPQGVVDLPSNGAKALIRPMKVREQKEVLKALEKGEEYLINEAFDAILANCVITINDEPFDSDKLCIQDRAYLLIKVRELTTGPKAKIVHISPETQKKHDVELELDKLVINKYQGTGLYKSIDIAPSVKMNLGPVTRKNEKAIEAYMRENKKESSLVDRRYAAYAAILKSLTAETEEGGTEVVELTFAQSLEFISSLTQKELDLFDNYIKSELNFGIDLHFHLKDGSYDNPKEELALLSFFIM